MRIDKEFETTQETSERLNVTARTIQKWAATGKIPGAIKYGNVWMIPKGITLSRKAVVEKAEEYIETRTIWDPESILIDPLDEISSLLNSPYSIEADIMSFHFGLCRAATRQGSFLFRALPDEPAGLVPL